MPARVSEFSGNLRQYIVVMVIIGTAIGTLNTIWFYLLGVPMPLLWGVLSGILNFIPFIGFWFGLLPPAILTLLAYGPRAHALHGGRLHPGQCHGAECDPAANWSSRA